MLIHSVFYTADTYWVFYRCNLSYFILYHTLHIIMSRSVYSHSTYMPDNKLYIYYIYSCFFIHLGIAMNLHPFALQVHSLYYMMCIQYNVVHLIQCDWLWKFFWYVAVICSYMPWRFRILLLYISIHTKCIFIHVCIFTNLYVGRI